MQGRRMMLALAAGALVCMQTMRGAVTIEPLQGESPAAGAMPTIADAQIDLDNGRYTWCMQKIDRLLNAKPEPTPGEQYALLSLKGECLLQDREAGPAAQTFLAASKAATDKTEIGTASATAVLVQRSSNYTYIPVAGKEHRPLSMLDKKKRPAALSALWADELAKVKPAVDLALKSPDTQSAMGVMPRVRDLTNFEVAATGGSSTCDAMAKSLQDHTETIVAGRIAEWNTATDNMTISGMKMVTVSATNDMPAHTQRMGLSGEEKSKVNDMLGAIAKLPEEVKGMCTAMGADPSLYAPDLTASETLAKRLHNMLLGVFRPVRVATRPAAPVVH